MTNKHNTKTDEVISLEVDEATQKEILKNPHTAKVIKEVFEAVWWLQDKIDKKID